MSHLVENDPVRTLFQDEQLPASYAAVLQRILNDNWITLRVQDLMARYFAARAIAQAQDAELYGLRKRISLALADSEQRISPANLENAHERTRLHNTGDHSKCTPATCFIKAHPVATTAEVPIQEPEPQVVTPRPAPTRPHISWYVDPAGLRIAAEVPNDEVRWFTGAPKDAAKFEFRGETCPAHIVAQYARLKA